MRNKENIWFHENERNYGKIQRNFQASYGVYILVPDKPFAVPQEVREVCFSTSTK